MQKRLIDKVVVQEKTEQTGRRRDAVSRLLRCFYRQVRKPLPWRSPGFRNGPDEGNVAGGEIDGVELRRQDPGELVVDGQTYVTGDVLDAVGQQLDGVVVVVEDAGSDEFAGEIIGS